MRYLFATLVSALLLSACSGSSNSGSSSSAQVSSSSSSEVSSVSSSSSSSAPASSLVPFVLPFDDASDNATNLAYLNHKPAGIYGHITVNDTGHFVAGGEPIRFWGVNITSDSSFPSADNAEKVAARLAKFGVNLVRFHHMDYGWSGMNTPSLIDYPAGNGRSLNAENLARLDYFIYQLKQQGIYVNLNLLNSRYFYAADGLPAAISQLDWKESHVLGFFNQTFRNLEKEYAQQLLTHTNPHTGLTYAEDPAIVMVEINNENSIFQQYYDGAIDSWPAVFRDELTGHWNDWLQDRYNSTAEAEASWGAINQPESANLLSNGTFASGTTSWNTEWHGGAAGTFTSGTYAGRAGLRWEVATAGGDIWHAQLNQSPITLNEGTPYTLRFSARADSALTLGAALQQDYGSYSLIEARSFALNSQWQDIEFQFIANVSDDNLRVNFNGFGNQQAVVYLADVMLTSGGSIGQLPEGETVESGSVSLNRRDSAYPEGRSRDWAAFLRDLEYDYWTDMRDYVKQTLGYQGLVAGTTIMNSPPSAQGQFDFADGHSYWQHPVFPGEPWDPVNWRVGNQSMVNSINNTLGNLSRERIHGLPFTVSEYQHSSPNTYSSEAPLLIAAYAALQDWDGIMMFAYDAAGNDNWDSRRVDNFFSMNPHPTKMANMLAGALLYRRGDVTPAEQAVLINFDADTELNVLATNGRSWNVANGSHVGVPADLALRHRVALDLTANEGQSTPPAAAPGPVYSADTGQLQWDLSQNNKGVVSVNTDHSKAIIGFINGRVFDLDGVRIAIGNTLQDWATLSLSTKTGSFSQPDQPASMLLITTGRMENTGMIWNATGDSVGNNWGTAPTRIEVIPATVDLPFAADKTRAWALNQTGERMTELVVESHQGKARLQLGTAATLWYEIEAE